MAPWPQQIPGAAAPSAVALLAVARVSDGAVLAKLADKSASSAEVQVFEGALEGLLERAARLPAFPNWKASQGLGEEGCVHVLADPQALCVVAAAVRGQYSERLAHALLQELAKEVRAAETEERLSEAKAGALTGSLKGRLRALLRTYSEPAKMDKVAEVHEKVDRVKGLMQDNVKKILETHVTIESLESKSITLSISANQFLKQSTDLKRQVQARNLRVKAVTATVASALVLYLSMPLLGH